MEELDELRLRDLHIVSTGYVKVSPPLVQTLVPLCPLLEIGAGTGALAQTLRSRGGRVVATDSYESHHPGGWHGSAGRVVRAEASRAVRLIRRVPGVNLLCSWPSYDNSWCTQALSLLPVGRKFALVSEGPGGCCGDDSLFELLTQDFRRIEEVGIPNFWGIHDYLAVYYRVSGSLTNVCRV